MLVTGKMISRFLYHICVCHTFSVVDNHNSWITIIFTAFGLSSSYFSPFAFTLSTKYKFAPRQQVMMNTR